MSSPDNDQRSGYEVEKLAGATWEETREQWERDVWPTREQLIEAEKRAPSPMDQMKERRGRVPLSDAETDAFVIKGVTIYEGAPTTFLGPDTHKE